MKKVRIGILGGSFDPAHEGHIYISDLAIKYGKFKQLWWMVAQQNPLKERSASPIALRIAIAKKITKNKKVKIFPAKEMYSYNLLQRLKKLHPNYEFIWVMGADNLEHFRQWYKWEKMLNSTEIMVFARGKETPKHPKIKKGIRFYRIHKMNISSTDLRA